MLSTGRRRSLFYSLWFKTRGKKKLTRRERQKHSTLRFSQSIKSPWWFYKSIRIILSPAFVTSQKDRHTPSFPPPPPPARERERERERERVFVRARASEREKERERERAFETIRREEEEGVREKNWISIGKEGRFYTRIALSSARDVPRLLHGVRVELRSPGYRG